MTVTVSLLVFLAAGVVVATEQYTSSSSKSHNYYIHSGVHFLKHYAEKYDLLSKFLESNNTQLIYQNTSLSSDIRSSYKVRNYNTYPHWEMIAVADRNPFSDDANVSTGYYPMEISKEFVPQELRPAAYYFNNQFRYGPKPMDRFIAIVFKNDPWIDEDAYVSFISTTQHYDLSGKMSTVYCSFTYPIQSRSRFQNADGRAFVQRCKIPSELSKTLTQQHHYVGVDLVYDGGVLLKNIKVKRLNYLDRRHFNTSAYIWTYNLHDVMLVEWITYNLMLGVEHFYIFDHRRLYPPLNGTTAVNKSYNGAAHFELENSQLIPFLDANIVTLIHYSFSPSIDNPSVYVLQAVSFFYVLEQFGKYNKYITFCDYDEFFLPSANYHKLLHARDRPSTYFTDILNIFDDEKSTQRWPGHPRPPISTLAFNSMDMGCSEAEEIDVHEVGNYVPIRKRSSTAKTAATTHCTVEGVLFHQFGLINGTFVDSDPFPYQGQGKVIIKPASELENPHCHMSGEPWLGTEFNGGIFCHYTNLRLSMMAAGGLDRKLFKSVLSPAANITCRDFALKMVKLYAEVIEK